MMSSFWIWISQGFFVMWAQIFFFFPVVVSGLLIRDLDLILVSCKAALGHCLLLKVLLKIKINWIVLKMSHIKIDTQIAFKEWIKNDWFPYFVTLQDNIQYIMHCMSCKACSLTWHLILVIKLAWGVVWFELVQPVFSCVLYDYIFKGSKITCIGPSKDDAICQRTLCAHSSCVARQANYFIHMAPFQESLHNN